MNAPTSSPAVDLVERLRRFANRSLEDCAPDRKCVQARDALCMIEAADAIERLAALTTPAPAIGEEDWFLRNANRRDPKAFINTDPKYFADECAAAIINGSLRSLGDEGRETLGASADADRAGGAAHPSPLVSAKGAHPSREGGQ